MQVRSPNDSNKFVTWDLRESKWPVKSKEGCRSKLQFEIGQWLQAKFSFDVLLEDVTIPDSRLSLDFFLPQRKIAVEVQGQQHFEQSSLFHKSKKDFYIQVERDEEKQYSCDLNNIRLIKVAFLEEIRKIFL